MPARAEARTQRLCRTLGPEFVAVPVHGGAGFDLDVAVDGDLASESHFFFVANFGHGHQRVVQRRHPLQDALFARVLHSLFDQYAAGTTDGESMTIEQRVFVNSGIEIDAGLEGFLA